ncbi:hypothetical protein PIB30_086000, partial [Stylosanthes scabra]|nr:hypothetical protein [Stylosanthes scabra]
VAWVFLLTEPEGSILGPFPPSVHARMVEAVVTAASGHGNGSCVSPAASGRGNEKNRDPAYSGRGNGSS